MERINRKLNSQTGASITFALLLFLVCAILSAVILVSATVAAGRISGLAESDQRYYSVTSAAELLKDALGEGTVTIVKVDKTDETESLGSEGDLTAGNPANQKSEIYLVNGAANELDLSNSAIQLSQSGETSHPVWGEPATFGNLANYFACQYALLKNNPSDPLTPSEPKTLRLNVNSSSDPSLNVTMDCSMTKDGNLAVQIGSTGDKPYKLTLRFEADLKKSEDKNVMVELQADSNRDRDPGQVVRQLSDVTKTSVNWRLTDIESIE